VFGDRMGMPSAFVFSPQKIIQIVYSKILAQMIGMKLSRPGFHPNIHPLEKGVLNVGFAIGSGSAASDWLRTTAVFPTGWPVATSACPTRISCRIGWGSILILV
jgi:hypothetical protein